MDDFFDDSDFDFGQGGDTSPVVTDPYDTYYDDETGTGFSSVDYDTSSFSPDWSKLQDYLLSPTGGALTSGVANLVTSYLKGQALQEGAKKQSDILSSSSQSSLAAQKEMAQKAIDAQMEMFRQSMGLQQPYNITGQALLPAFALYASGQDEGRKSLQNLSNGELYEWQKEQATEALNRQLSARGRYDSGAAIKGFSDLYRTMAGEESEKRYNRAIALENSDYQRLVDAMNLGRGAAAQGSNIATSTGNVLSGIYSNLGGNLGNTYMNYGAQAAQPAGAAANATASMYGTVGNTITDALNKAVANKNFEQFIALMGR